MSTDAILQVNGLSKRFGGLKAVDDVSFDVARGQITALIGPNGAGKSTTFNLVTGHNKPDSGTVTFDGHDVTGKKPNVLADKGVARSFQSARLFPSMTVRQILLTATMLRESGAAARALADQVLEEVGLAEQGDRRPNELSLPQRQMVELGKCVALQPKMIMLDEIMGGLNRVECALPIAAIERLRDRGMTFLLVEHVMPIVMSLADQIVVLDFGRRIATGTPSEIVENKAVQESYLGGVDDSLEA